VAGDTSGSVTLSAPDVAGTTTLTLPSTSGNVLTSASSVANSQLSAGHVLQVASTTKTDTWSASTPNWVDITGMSVSITPSSTSNKILVLVNLSFMTTGGAAHGYRIVRDSTAISIGDAAGSRPRFSGSVQDNNVNTSWIDSSVTNYLDSPASTSSVTYKLQAFGTYAGSAMYVNKSSADRDNTEYDGRTTSSITVMEIKG
jgi:hypothetical protein